MSLCWYSEADESTVSLKVRLLLALDDFLFEDLPRYGSLLSIWAGALVLSGFCGSIIFASPDTNADEQPVTRERKGFSSFQTFRLRKVQAQAEGPKRCNAFLAPVEGPFWKASHSTWVSFVNHRISRWTLLAASLGSERAMSFGGG